MSFRVRSVYKRRDRSNYENEIPIQICRNHVKYVGFPTTYRVEIFKNNSSKYHRSLINKREL